MNARKWREAMASNRAMLLDVTARGTSRASRPAQEQSLPQNKRAIRATLLEMLDVMLQSPQMNHIKVSV